MYKVIFFIFSILLSFSGQIHADNSLKNLNTLIQQNQGKVIYIDFWASWCAPCKKSFPWMNKINKTYKDLEVISVNVDSEKSYATEFLDSTPANFPIVYDPNGKIAKKYKLKGMPSSYVINKKGQLVSSHVGFNESKKEKYEQELKRLIAE
jgi:thiol-disulfide isomerase/thioredoxin